MKGIISFIKEGGHYDVKQTHWFEKNQCGITNLYARNKQNLLELADNLPGWCFDIAQTTQMMMSVDFPFGDSWTINRCDGGSGMG